MSIAAEVEELRFSDGATIEIDSIPSTSARLTVGAG